jgi:hypothetical protein
VPRCGIGRRAHAGRASGGPSARCRPLSPVPAIPHVPDAESANHAALSITHALREGLLEDAPSPVRRLVLGRVPAQQAVPASAALPGPAHNRTGASGQRQAGHLLGHDRPLLPGKPQTSRGGPERCGPTDRYTPAVLDTVLNSSTEITKQSSM